MISLRIYQVINVKSPIDGYRLTTVRVNEMFASCTTPARDHDQLIWKINYVFANTENTCSRMNKYVGFINIYNCN